MSNDGRAEAIANCVESSIQNLQDAHRALTGARRLFLQAKDEAGEMMAHKAQRHIEGDLHALVDYIKTVPQNYWSKDWRIPANLPNLSIHGAGSY